MDNIIMVGGFHEMVELCEDCGLNIIGIIDNKMSGIYEGVKSSAPTTTGTRSSRNMATFRWC